MATGLAGLNQADFFSGWWLDNRGGLSSGMLLRNNRCILAVPAGWQKRVPMKALIKRIPFVGTLQQLYWKAMKPARPRAPFPGSAEYWESRYAAGGNSGSGSYAQFAQFKAEVLNDFVAKQRIRSVIEFGCGDGNQLSLAKYPQYLGFDVSSTAVARCRELFASDPTKSFELVSNYSGQKADLVMSLDVIYHLVEDSVYEGYMRALFAASNGHVVIYASDTDNNKGYEGTHVRHRKFTAWVAQHFPTWQLAQHIPNRHPNRGDDEKGSFADFYFYKAA